MIREAFRHLPGIGPERLAILRAAGIRTWDDIGDHPPPGLKMGADGWRELRKAVALCHRAWEQTDLQYLVNAFAIADHWRILASWFPQASFFDIETTGLSADSQVSLIGCYHRQRLHVFIRGKNMADFLDLLDDVTLLVSFNGSSFDVPRVLEAFHIPALPCPHVDLRWLCYHARLTGGLKRVERSLGIARPADLAGVEGAEAVRLWNLWQKAGIQTAGRKLVRYCCADVLSLQTVAANLLKKCAPDLSYPIHKPAWDQLDTLPLLTVEKTAQPGSGAHSFPGTGGTDTGSLRRRLRRHWRRHRSGTEEA